MSRNAPKPRRTRTAWLIALAYCTLNAAVLLAADGPVLSAAPTRAEVIAVRHPLATEAFKARPEIVELMVERGITRLTGQTNPIAAWRKIAGTNETIGIKVYTATGRNVGTRPEVAAAVVNGLIAAGVKRDHIIIWDRQIADLRAAGFTTLGETLGIRVLGAAEAGWNPKVYYDAALIGHLVYGDLEFGKKEENGVGRKSHLSKLLTRDITRIINIAPVLNHSEAGVSGNLYSLAIGGADNTWRFEASPERLATAVPDLYALPEISDRVVLNISDALICQYEGGQRDLLHYSKVMNELRFSRDPVALDVLALQDIEQSRNKEGRPSKPFNSELYKNAALIELGIADLKRIDVIPIHAALQGETNTR